MPLKYLSICSGIEAATVAWHGFGWEPVAFSEIDKFPSAVLSAHYPDVPNLGNMTAYTEWPEEMLGEVDILVGGTPCQAFSVAGKRESLGDDRGNLSLVFCNLYHRINEIRRANGRPPAIVVWENVPGVLSTKDNAFGCFIAGIMGLDEAVEPEKGKWHKAGFLSGEAFRVGYRVLDAQYFGVAQRRRRVFLVAMPCELVESLGERACPSEILSLRESVLGDPPTRGAAWEGSARATAASLTSSGRGVERCGESRGQDDVVVQAPQVANPLTARMGKGINTTCDEGQTPLVAFHPTQDPISSTDGSTHAMGCGSRQGCCTQAVAFKPSHFTRGKDGKPSEVTSPLSADADKGDQDTVIAFKPSQSEAAGATFTTNEFSPTLQGQNNGSTAVPAVALPIISDADRANSEAVTPSPDAEGRVRLRNPGIGIGGEGEPMFTLQATKPHAVAFKESQSGTRLGDVHATIDSNKGSRRQEGVVLSLQVRRLTPTECEFLQGFPAGYTDVVYRNKPAADGPRYRALGNSMAVPCMWWLGHRIREAITGN